MNPFEGSDFATLEILVQRLEQLVAQEVEVTQQAWVKASQLQARFQEKYHCGLPQVCQALGQNTLRQVLTNSRILAIYTTSLTEDFYIAFRCDVNPHLSHLVQTRYQRHRDVISPRTYEPNLPIAIAAAADLEQAIAEIVSSLAISTGDGVVPLNSVAQRFYALVGEPLRPTLRRICPETRLLTFLENCPQLSVQQQDGVVYLTRNE